MRAALPLDNLAEFCKRWKVKELSLFGSATRDDFGPDSDIDLLYTFEPNHGWSLLDVVRMERELTSLLGRRVDLVSRQGIEDSRNWLRRREILSTARRLYAA